MNTPKELQPSLKEWPVQTRMRSKTMDEHIEKTRCLFGKELSDAKDKEIERLKGRIAERRLANIALVKAVKAKDKEIEEMRSAFEQHIKYACTMCEISATCGGQCLQKNVSIAALNKKGTD